MFNLDPDERISEWSKFRSKLNQSENPFEELIDFWNSAPWVPHNKNVDPYNQYSWPTPWEIIVENHYDDFTKALMMSWTLKLTDKFKDSQIEIKTYADDKNNRMYNLVVVDNMHIINYNDNSSVGIENLPNSIRLRNLIEVKRPR